MATERIHIVPFLETLGQHLLLDVRSPAEYAHAHLPGAVSLPLFSDEERKIVGTLYKQESREKAIKAGLDFFGPKMRPMVEAVEALLVHRKDNNKTVQLYCWRGGMRSAAVAWLLDLYGFKVQRLQGGYKAYRNWALEVCTRSFNIKILGGFTGSGKTDVLSAMKQAGETVIDLEGLAQHKGSAFGGLKTGKQPSQEMFENNLALQLFYSTKNLSAMDVSIWMEDESQRIGNLNIPGPLWENMRNAPVYFLDIPFEERLDYLVKDYGDCAVPRMMEATERITKRLGGLEAKNTLEHFRQGNIKEAFRILLHYYDKQYLKGLHNRQNLSEKLVRIACDTVSNKNVAPLLQPGTI